MPATVQTVLAARIDRLPAEEKRLLQTAAVIGKDVPFVLLRAIAERPEAELQASLSRLQAGELLYPTTLFPEPEYTFKHALTHDVAYGSLLQERRKSLHARIVAAIEAVYGDRLDEHVERLAHHASASESPGSRPLAYAQLAGRRAESRSANREAVAQFEQALAALAHLPASRETLEQGIDLRLALHRCSSPIAEHRGRSSNTSPGGMALGRVDRRPAWPVFRSYRRAHHLESLSTARRQPAREVGGSVRSRSARFWRRPNRAGRHQSARSDYRHSGRGIRWLVGTTRDRVFARAPRHGTLASVTLDPSIAGAPCCAEEMERWPGGARRGSGRHR